MHLTPFVAFNNLLQIIQCVVAIATLVEAQGPVWGHGRTTYDLVVLTDHLFRLRTQEKIKVQDT